MDPKTRALYKLKKDKVHFRELVEIVAKKAAFDAAKKSQLQTHIEKLDNLQVQSILFKSLRAAMTAAELTSWSKHMALVTPSVANFARKALIRCLPTNTNLHLWGRSPSDSCPRCGALETENHVLNNCPVAATQGRYTWRHNAVLKILASHVQSHLQAQDKLFVDIPGYRNPQELFSSIIPDIIVVRGNMAVVLELTICYERNLVNSKLYKLNKYKDPASSCKMPLQFEVHTAEVSSLGFTPLADLTSFYKSLNISPPTPAMMRRVGETALRCSYFLFCLRHKPWPANPTDPYVPGSA